jgi:hypothetical protein
MKKVYYEKVGRKYVPVSEYNSELLDSFPKGNHIVMSYPGGTSRRFHIDPAFGPLIAAARYSEDAMTTAMVKASELRPQQSPLTPAQQAAWENLARELGNSRAPLSGASAYDVVAAGLRVLQEEADKLLKHEAVKQAYEQFLMVAALTKEHNEVAN